MRRMICTFVAVSLFSMAFAQTTKKAAKTPWKRTASLTILGAQTGSRNWAPANEKFSITGVALLHLAAARVKGKTQWDHSVDLSYGIANTESGGPRKVEDKLDLFSRYGYYFKSKLGAGMTAGLRTQFSNGFDYSEEPKKRISGFFAPAYLTISPGLHYKLFSNLILTAGPAARWIFVSNAPYSYNYQGGIKPDGGMEKSIAQIYGVHPERESRMEAGLFITAAFERKEIMKNIDYRTRAEFMTDMTGENVKGLDDVVLTNRGAGNADVYWTNTITMNVNKWIKVNYSFDLVYDDDVKIFGTRKDRPATQMRSLLGVGLSASF